MIKNRKAKACDLFNECVDFLDSFFDLEIHYKLRLIGFDKKHPESKKTQEEIYKGTKGALERL
jgi:hypothetical protein